MDGWRNESMDKRINDWMNEWMDEWIYEWMIEKWMNEWTNEWRNEYMNEGGMNGWKVNRSNKCTFGGWLNKNMNISLGDECKKKIRSKKNELSFQTH